MSKRLYVLACALATACAGPGAPAGPGGGGGKADDLDEVDGGAVDADPGAADDGDGGRAADAGADAGASGSPALRRSFAADWACPTDGGPVEVAFFDADSTLRVSKSGSVSANGIDDVDVLPFAAAHIAELNAAGVLVVVVSNQGGVAAGILPVEVAEGALAFTAAQLGELGGRVDYFDFAERRDEFRKPEIGMALLLDELLRERCGATSGVDLMGSFMVGDSGFKVGVDGPHPDGRPADDFSNADRGFAENLGVAFFEPTDYFGWRDFEVFNIASEAELVDFLALIEAADEGDGALRGEADENRRVNGLD